MLDKANHVIIAFEYDLIEKMQSNNLFIATKGDWNNDEKNVKSGVYNAKGELIVPVEYFGGINVIKGKMQDFILIMVNGKYGTMNDNGKFIYQPKYTFEEINRIAEKLSDS
ncbi:WG repeat-containing protein [Faucicola boevrei]|nr:WG repeat-containing protein [Moraxella boevrei]